MTDVLRAPVDATLPVVVPAGEDRFGEFKVLGISSVAYKVTSQESSDLFTVEITLQHKGGPARHLHYQQDEWFYFLEGEFAIEVGDKRMYPEPGDSIFAPRKVPHVWALIGETRGRFLASVMPAGNLEAFFVEAAKRNALPGPDQNQWQPYGMEWIGPPLAVV